MPCTIMNMQTEHSSLPKWGRAFQTRKIHGLREPRLVK